jgi:hypothetical protein
VPAATRLTTSSTCLSADSFRSTAAPAAPLAPTDITRIVVSTFKACPVTLNNFRNHLGDQRTRRWTSPIVSDFIPLPALANP